MGRASEHDDDLDELAEDFDEDRHAPELAVLGVLLMHHHHLLLLHIDVVHAVHAVHIHSGHVIIIHVIIIVVIIDEITVVAVIHGHERVEIVAVLHC